VEKSSGSGGAAARLGGGRPLQEVEEVQEDKVGEEGQGEERAWERWT
jgi:hypothetical protein